MDENKIRLSVSTGNEGYNKYIPRTDEGIKKIIDLIDNSVTEVLIKKEPTRCAPEEKIKGFSSNSHHHI